ncbi:MAG: ABC transporter ATP-binding protein [Comamonas sp.]
MNTEVQSPVPLAQIDNLRISFPSSTGALRPVVRGMSLSLMPGERLGIVGESGSGKSLTGRALLGMLAPGAVWSADAMRFKGQDLLAMKPGERRKLCGRDIGMILQDPKYSLNPVMTVAKQMKEAFHLREPSLKGAALQARMAQALEAVHIRDPQRVLKAYPHELSGGMGQRVMIAMMVSSGPSLLIADEPTSALDVLVAEQTLRVMDKMIAQHNTGLIFISHDLGLVSSFCDRVVVMYGGQVMESCAAADLQHASHPYTRGLLAASPKLSVAQNWLPTMQRDPAWLSTGAAR